MWICPLAIKRQDKKFLMCKLLSDGETSSIKKDLKAFCKFQKYCSCEGGVTHTNGARECYAQNKEKTPGKETGI